VALVLQQGPHHKDGRCLAAHERVAAADWLRTPTGDEREPDGAAGTPAVTPAGVPRACGYGTARSAWAICSTASTFKGLGVR
jgi:hypothetical protein